MGSNIFKFYTGNLNTEIVETKSGKKYFVTGDFTNSDLDLVNDVVTPECMADMVDQIKSRNITFDVEHEAFLGKTEEETKLNNSILPIAKVADFSFDGKSITVKAELNQHNSKFKETWGSLKDKFLHAFSFAFRPKNYTYSMKGNVKTRLLKKIDLLNITFTGNPVNPTATIKQVFAKSLDFAEQTGGDIVEDKKEEKNKEVVVDISSEIKSLKESIDEIKVDIKSLVEVKDTKTEEVKSKDEPKKVEQKSEVSVLKKELESTKKEVAEMKALLEQPQMKSIVDHKKVDGTEKEISPLDLF